MGQVTRICEEAEMAPVVTATGKQRCLLFFITHHVYVIHLISLRVKKITWIFQFLSYEQDNK